MDPAHKLGLCEGDCDTSSHCANELICYQRNDYAAVPGCTGQGVKDYDYCVEPKDNILRGESVDEHLTGELQKCQGDCNSDSHCAGNLVCYQRSGYSSVPGCLGLGIENFDYCIEQDK